jgi:hypothetical protein
MSDLLVSLVGQLELQLVNGESNLNCTDCLCSRKEIDCR